MYEAALSALAVRELSGFVTTNSPRRALAIAARLKTTAILDIPTPEETIALRAEKHLREMRRYVPRARKGPGGRERCIQAGMVYLRERPQLAGKAREVTKTGKKWKVAGKVREFDRALWERGLTTKGREAVAELVSLGNPEPMPADVLQFLLKNRVED